jgi:2-methylisocitrate lyase-like PEP mutase family enzyme
MTDQTAKAQAFKALHKKGDPVILYNAWDPGSAQVVAGAGAKAIATGSYSVAAAFGFADGETTPLDIVLGNCRRIADAVDLPVTLDFEGGYATQPNGLARNIAQVIDAGAVGINFEDQVVGGTGLHDTADQAARIAAVRAAADRTGGGFFINARCDVFLQADRATHGPALAAAWLERGRAYAEAGANGLFAPGLVDPALIGELVQGSPLPLNILMMAGAPDVAALKALGVARISYGGGPYRVAMRALEAAARAVFQS